MRRTRKCSPVVTAILLIASGLTVELVVMQVIGQLKYVYDPHTLDLWDSTAVGLIVAPVAALIMYLRHPREVEPSGTSWALRYKPWIHGVAAGMSVLSLAGIILLLDNHAGHQVLKDRVDSELIGLARAAAAQVDPEAHAQLTSPEQLNGPLYKAAVTRLRQLHTALPTVKYMYTMVQSPQGLRFGVDTTAPGDRERDGVADQPGLLELYPHPDPAMLQAFQTGVPAVSQKVQTDKWGSFISAFAPVFDAKGNVALIVGVDYTASQYAAEFAGIDRGTLLGILVALVGSVLFGTGVFVVQQQREFSVGRLKAASKALESQAQEREFYIAQLMDMKQFAQTTIDALSYQVAVLDETGKIITVNKTWNAFAEANGGIEAACGIGANYLAICDEAVGDWNAEAADVAQGIRAVIDGELDVFTLEYPCHSPVELRWFTLRVTRFPGDGPVRVVVAHEDISQRKRAEIDLALANADLEVRVQERTMSLEQAHWEAQHALDLVDATADGVFIFDQEFRLTYVNQGAIEQVGYTREELHTMSILDIKPKFSRESFQQLLAPLTSRQCDKNSIETVHRHRDGRNIPVEVNLRYTESTGDTGQYVSVARDITERQAARELLVAAKEEAEHANRAKSEFLSRMSHELRTPLNAVLGFAQLLEIQSEDPNTIQSAESIIRGGRHLLDLVNEVLDMARIEVGKLSVAIHTVDLSQVVVSSIELLRPMAAEKGIEFVVDHDSMQGVQVEADRQRLAQVVMNLLSNAIKYNCAEGRVVVRCATRDQTWCRIEISDTGPGIDSENLERLFVPFERLGDHQAEGTGLGLVVSKGLMELMGGTLLLVSTSKLGSTFALEIRTSQEAARPTGDAIISHEPHVWFDRQELKIVYVEDNLDNILLIERAFADHPHVELAFAKDVVNGLKLIRQVIPDLVLLDLHLPDGTGSDVLHGMLQDPATAKIPVVILSADASPSQIEALTQQGARAYLTKPIEVTDLFELIESLIPVNGGSNVREAAR